MPIVEMGDEKVLVLVGSHEEMGWEHGRVFREQVGLLIEQFLKRGEALFGLPYSSLLDLSKDYEPHIPDFYKAEMHALSEGAEVPYADILGLNALVDVDACYSQRLGQCCNVVMMMADGHLAHGRNLDFPVPPRVNRDASVIIARNPSEPDLIPSVSITWAGYIGSVTGCNARGLSIGVVTSPGNIPVRDGVPLSIMLRQVMEQSVSLEEAYALVSTSPRTGGYNIAVTDGPARAAMGIECTPELCEARMMDRRFLVVDDLCLCRRTSHARLTTPAGVLRHARAVQMLCEAPCRGSLERLLQILADRWDLSEGVQREADYRGYNTICNVITVHSVVFLPQAQRLLVSNKAVPAPLAQYHSIDLRELFAVLNGDGSCNNSERKAT